MRVAIAPTVVLLASLAVAADATRPEPGAAMSARIELKGRYYRAGEPIEVRIVLDNATAQPIPNPEGMPLVAGLGLDLPDGAQKPASVAPFDPSSQPKVFLPGSTYMQVVDLAPHFPVLTKPGTYKLHFKSGPLEAAVVDVVVAAAYDPALDYRATLKTDFGDLVFDLLEDAAPDHVRNFVDLARRGFYDNTKFFVIAKGELIGGGDPTGDGKGGPGYSLPPEITTIPHERGTLCAARPPEFGGFDHGSQFFIELGRAQERDGNFSVFGKLVEGDEALQALEGVATNGKNMTPFFRPLKDTLIRKVTVEGRPKAPAPVASAPPKG